MMGDQEPEKEVDFEVLEEPWARYKLKDGTTIRLRIPVVKIFESLKKGPLGYPNFRIASQSLVSALVPETLKGEPSDTKEVKPEDYIEESKIIQRLEETWQRYKTEDGWIIKVKPFVRKIFKSNKYNNEGEPIYSVDWQVIIDVEKSSS